MEYGNITCLVEYDKSKFQKQFGIDQVLTKLNIFDFREFLRNVGSSYARIIQFEGNTVTMEAIVFGNRSSN